MIDKDKLLKWLEENDKYLRGELDKITELIKEGSSEVNAENLYILAGGISAIEIIINKLKTGELDGGK